MHPDELKSWGVSTRKIDKTIVLIRKKLSEAAAFKYRNHLHLVSVAIFEGGVIMSYCVVKHDELLSGILCRNILRSTTHHDIAFPKKIHCVLRHFFYL